MLLTLITAAAGVFGYFFFSGKDYYDYVDAPGGEKLTRAEAKTLVSRAITDINNINNTTSTASQTLSMDFSDRYEDYESEHFSYSYPVTDAKVFLQVAKFLLEDEDVSEDTSYLCRYSNGEYDLNGDSSTALSFKLGEDAILIQADNIWNSNQNFDFELVIKLSKGAEGDNSWVLEVYQQILVSGNRVAAQYATTFCKNSNIYRIVVASYKEDSFNNSGIVITNLIYDQNRETDKVVYETNIENLAEHKNTVNNQFKEITFKDWSNETYVAYDFMDAFKEQGDHGEF